VQASLIKQTQTDSISGTNMYRGIGIIFDTLWCLVQNS